ncbi:MAG: hypothetical protein PHZ04_00305 [Patescibacteria group bacterium]|nr:hypothetical protein [Patescibacteria group bacterium]MDD5294611.1 hypothetical protein [Patescibacteria group bacterium]MDD5555024.1 hypothetical protein [Patescibacteria group bacterium]
MAGRESCVLSGSVLPNNFKQNENIIAVQTGNGVMHVFKDALMTQLCKIGVGEPDTISRIRHTRPGQIFEGMAELIEKAITKIEEVAALIAERTEKKIDEAIKTVRSLIQRLIQKLNLNISLTPA